MQNKYVVILLTSFLLLSCHSGRKLQKVNTKETPKQSIKEITKLERLWGIDISHYQQIESWDKVKEQAPDFIFLKTTEGSTHQDNKYATYYQEIRKQKIPVGSYHFFTYLSSGKDQAANFLSVVNYKKGDLPLVLDAEFARKMPDKATIIREIQAFINAVYEKTQCHPIIYCDYKYYLQYLKNSVPDRCKLWIVDYRGMPNCSWTFWQTTDKYRAAGIKGYVDFNLFNGTRKDFMNLLN